MPWILPTGFNDPSAEWEDEANALDGDEATSAIRSGVEADTYTGYLEFTFSRATVLRVQLCISTDIDSGYLDVDQYDGEWTIISQWSIGHERKTIWTAWVGGIDLTAVRVRFKNRRWDIEDALIHWVKLEATCFGPLLGICKFLTDVGTFFIDLSLDIVELWLIGRFLAEPFEFLGELFYLGADTCCSASGTLQTLLDGLEDGLTVDALLTIFQDHFPTLYAIITDPVGWFLVQLTLAFDLEPWHTQSLEFLAKWILETYFPTLYQIWLDPLGEIVRWVSQYSSFVAGLFIDPAKQIRWTVGEILGILPGMYDHPEAWPEMLFEGHFPALYAFWLDPEAWLVEHVDPRVRDIPEAIAAFLADPWGWLFDRLEDQIETYAVRIGELSLEIIARLLGV